MSLEHSVYKATARPLYDAEFHEESVEFLDIYKTCLRISELFLWTALRRPPRISQNRPGSYRSLWLGSYNIVTQLNKNTSSSCHGSHSALVWMPYEYPHFYDARTHVSDLAILLYVMRHVYLRTIKYCKKETFVQIFWVYEPLCRGLHRNKPQISVDSLLWGCIFS